MIEMLLLSLASVAGAAFLIPILVGAYEGGRRDMPWIGALLGLLVGLGLSALVLNYGGSMIRQKISDDLAREAGPAFYEEVAGLKGRRCDVDAAIAKAMRDGRLSYRDVLDVRAVDARRRGAEARSRLMDGSVTAQGCNARNGPRPVTGRATPSVTKS